MPKNGEDIPDSEFDFEKVQPVNFRTEQEIDNIQTNRLIIHQESALSNSITDSSLEDDPSRHMGRNLNLTEYERQVRRAHGLSTPSLS